MSKLSKKLELIHNHAGGVDLMVERDAGNLFRILTGKKERSIKFYRDLITVAEEALEEMEATPRNPLDRFEFNNLDKIDPKV